MHDPISQRSPTPERDYCEILRGSLLVLAASLAIIAICYFWIDRPVDFYVHDQAIEKIRVFKWLTFPPPLLEDWAPVVLTLLVVRRVRGPFVRWQKLLLVACLSLVVADNFRTSLGELLGRYWPETWFDDNPSLIGNGTYGFHPFQWGDDTGSFPSGHAARILGFASVWWLAMPKSRAICVLVCLPMLVSLIAMDYHFVSDVVAGSTLGAIVGAYATRLAKLRSCQEVCGEAG
ncbi:MAG TPA: phosphatase PAP2 family protein [Pirellulales bacterium]|nr:phosphatase PAP2 family protein [Pirellulales bacterium]